MKEEIIYPKTAREWLQELYPDCYLYNPFDLKWYFNLSALDYRMMQLRNNNQSLLQHIIPYVPSYVMLSNEINLLQKHALRCAFGLDCGLQLLPRIPV